MNISLLLQMAADADPDRIGLVCDGRRWTYAELLKAAKGAAGMFRDSGCSHVGLLDESSEAAVLALFGAAMAGIPYVPLNYRLADPDLAALLGRIAPACLIGDTQRIERLDGLAGHHLHTRADFVATAEAASAGIDVADEAGEGVAVQIFTSGTTTAARATGAATTNSPAATSRAASSSRSSNAIAGSTAPALVTSSRRLVPWPPTSTNAPAAATFACKEAPFVGTSTRWGAAPSSSILAAARGSS